MFLAAECLGVRGMEKLAIELAQKVIDEVARQNRRSSALGLPDPYYGVGEVMHGVSVSELLNGQIEELLEGPVRVTKERVSRGLDQQQDQADDLHPRLTAASGTSRR